LHSNKREKRNNFGRHKWRIFNFATLSSRVQLNTDTVSTLAQPSPPTAGIPNLPWPPCSIINRDQEILQKKKDQEERRGINPSMPLFSVHVGRLPCSGSYRPTPSRLDPSSGATQRRCIAFVFKCRWSSGSVLAFRKLTVLPVAAGSFSKHILPPSL